MANGAMHEDLMTLGRNLARQNSMQQQSMLFPNRNIVAPDPFSGVSPDAYSRRYAGDILTAERSAASAFADQASRESLTRTAGDLIGDAAFGVGMLAGTAASGGNVFVGSGVGIGLSLLTEQVLNATGFFDFDPLVSLDNQARAMVDGSVHKFAYNMGGSSFDRGISMDEASTIGNNLFDQARDAGFHGVEASRVLDTLGQYGSKLHMRTGSADDIASQLEEYLDGVMDIVKRTGDSMERASQMIGEAKMMGVGPGSAAGFYGTISDYSTIAGINPNQMIAMGQQHAAPFASGGFGYGDVMTSFAGGMAQAGMMSDSSENAALWAAIGGPAQYGMHQAQLGSAFVSNPAMWGKMMGGGSFDQSSWNAMLSGQARPDSYGDAYADLNTNDRLVARYQGMQEVMGRSGQWTQAATGSLFQQMGEEDITDFRAQSMWLYEGGYAPNLATARQDVSTHLRNQNPDVALNTTIIAARNTQTSGLIAQESQINSTLDVLDTAGSILSTTYRPLTSNPDDFSENLFTSTTSRPGSSGSIERLMFEAGSTMDTGSLRGEGIGPELITNYSAREGSHRIPVAALESAIIAAGVSGNTSQVSILGQILSEGDRYTGVAHGVDYNPDGTSRAVHTQFYHGANDNWWEKLGTNIKQGASDLSYIYQGWGNAIDRNLSTDRGDTSTVAKLLWLGDSDDLYTGIRRLLTDETAMIDISYDVVQGIIDEEFSEQTQEVEGAHYLSGRLRPTGALSMYARQTGWFNRLSSNEQNSARTFGRDFNARAESYALMSNQLSPEQLNRNLDMWQTPAGMDSGWLDFLDKVGNNNAVFNEEIGFGGAYSDFASQVYGVGGHLALTDQQERYLNTYLGVNGAGGRAQANSLESDLLSAARLATTSEGYRTAMESIRLQTGLEDDKINNIALYGTYRAQSSQISAQLESSNLSSQERRELIAQKTEYDQGMNQLTLDDPGLQQMYNEHIGLIGSIAGSEDMVIRIAGAGNLDEDMARADDVWRRASGHMSDIMLQEVSLKELQSMDSETIAKYIDLEAARAYDGMGLIVDKIEAGEALNDFDFLALQDIADMNPDTPKENGISLDGSSDDNAFWVRFSGASEDSLAEKIAVNLNGQTHPGAAAALNAIQALLPGASEEEVI